MKYMLEEKRKCYKKSDQEREMVRKVFRGEKNNKDKKVFREEKEDLKC